MQEFRIGQGFDAHRLVEGRILKIGGVIIPFEKGLLGHSDADVLVHAIMDAICGALTLGDIGIWFPNTSDKFINADSLHLLSCVLSDEKVKSWKIVNIDSTIIAERPRLSSYFPEMRKNIAETIAVNVEQVSVKATTSEKMGFCGREEGIASFASVLLSKA